MTGVLNNLGQQASINLHSTKYWILVEVLHTRIEVIQHTRIEINHL